MIEAIVALVQEPSFKARSNVNKEIAAIAPVVPFLIFRVGDWYIERINLKMLVSRSEPGQDCRAKTGKDKWHMGK